MGNEQISKIVVFTDYCENISPTDWEAGLCILCERFTIETRFFLQHLKKLARAISVISKLFNLRASLNRAFRIAIWITDKYRPEYSFILL